MLSSLRRVVWCWAEWIYAGHVQSVSMVVDVLDERSQRAEVGRGQPASAGQLPKVGVDPLVADELRAVHAIHRDHDDGYCDSLETGLQLIPVRRAESIDGALTEDMFGWRAPGVAAIYVQIVQCSVDGNVAGNAVPARGEVGDGRPRRQKAAEHGRRRGSSLSPDRGGRSADRIREAGCCVASSTCRVERGEGAPVSERG